MTPGCLINTPVPTLPFKCGTRINTRIGAERRNNRTVSPALHLTLCSKSSKFRSQAGMIISATQERRFFQSESDERNATTNFMKISLDLKTILTLIVLFSEPGHKGYNDRCKKRKNMDYATETPRPVCDPQICFKAALSCMNCVMKY